MAVTLKELQDERDIQEILDAQKGGDQTEKMIDEILGAPPEKTPDPRIAAYNKQSGLKKAYDNLGNVAGGINKGILDIVDMPVNLGNLVATGVNKAAEYFGAEPNMLNMGIPPSEWGGEYKKYNPLKQMRDFGTGRVVPKGANKLSDMLRTGAEWGSGAVLPAGGALTKAGKAPIPPSSVVAPAIQADIAAAGGAMAGEAVGDKHGIPWLSDAAGLAGGLFGGAKAAPTPYDLNVTDSTDLDALNFIKQRSPQNLPDMDIEATLKQLDNERGTATLGDITGDRQILGLEDAMTRRKGSRFKEGVEQIDAARADKAMRDVGDIIPEGKGEPFTQSAARQTALRGEQIQKTQDAQARQIEADTISETQDAFDTVDMLEHTATVDPKVSWAPATADAGLSGHKAQTALKKELEAAAKKEWAKFDKSPPIDIKEPIAGMLDDFNAKYDPNSVDYTAMVKKYKTEAQRINEWMKADADPKDVQAVLRDVKEKIHDVYTERGKLRHIDSMMDELVAGVENTLASSPATKAWEPAVAATKAIYDRALPERVSKAVKSKDKEAFYSSLNLAGEAGGSTARQLKLADDPRVTEAAKNALRAKAKKLMRSKEGKLDRKFLNAHEDFLNHFPDLKADLIKMVKRQDIVDEGIKTFKKWGEKRQIEGDAALAATKKKGGLVKGRLAETPIAQYTKDPKKYLAKQLKANNAGSLSNLKRLHAHAKNSGTTEGLRSQVNTIVQDMMFKPKGGLKRATGGSIDTFNEMKGSLVESGIMTKSETDSISKTIERIREIEARRKKGAPVDIKNTLSALEDLLAAGTGAAAAKASGAKGLMVLATIKKSIVSLLKDQLNDPEMLLRVEKMLLNPRRFIRAVEGAKDIEAAKKHVALELGIGTGKTAGKVLKKAAKFRQPYSEDQE